MSLLSFNFFKVIISFKKTLGFIDYGDFDSLNQVFCYKAEKRRIQIVTRQKSRAKEDCSLKSIGKKIGIFHIFSKGCEY